MTHTTDSLQAQLAKHETDDLEVVGSIPSRGKFFILLFSINADRILPRFGRKRRIIEKLDYSRYFFTIKEKDSNLKPDKDKCVSGVMVNAVSERDRRSSVRILLLRNILLSNPSN